MFTNNNIEKFIPLDYNKKYVSTSTQTGSGFFVYELIRKVEQNIICLPNDFENFMLNE